MRCSFLTKFLTFLILLLIVFTRLFNLGQFARFTRDEASDLNRMHQYWQDKKVTLVGPISSDNEKVFSSLTYYMLMPFAVVGNFSLISPVYGTAFYGILTALLLLILASRTNENLFYLTAILSIVWYPLLQTSKWAWNPHLIPFWVTLGLLLISLDKTAAVFLGGLSLGLAVHHHFVAGLSVGLFVLIKAVSYYKTHDYRQLFLILTGFGLSLVPFLIFDLRHPPGLFIGKYIFKRQAPGLVSLKSAVNLMKLLRLFKYYFKYIFQNGFFSIIGLGLFMAVNFWDFKFNKKNLIWVYPVFLQIFGSLFFKDLAVRYFIPALIFYWMWLIQPRRNWGRKLALFIIVLMILGNVMNIKNAFGKSEIRPTLQNTQKISNLIINKCRTNSLENINLAVLASPDRDPLAEKYRYLFEMKGVKLLEPSQFQSTQNLFLISTSDFKTVNHTSSNISSLFSKENLNNAYSLENSNWKVYWITK